VAHVTLVDAYAMIVERYQQLQMASGVLESVGLSGHWTVVKGSAEQSGLAFAFNGEHAVYGELDTEPLLSLQKFVGKPLFLLAEHLLGQQTLVLKAALVATLNALTRPLVLGDHLEANYGKHLYCSEPGDWLDFLRPEDRVTMVGHGPVGDVLARVRACSVCDMRPRSVLQTLSVGESIEYGPKGIDVYQAADAPALLADSSVVLITGSTLVNGTINGLVDCAAGARVIGVYGWSASILPEYLVRIGVNYIAAHQMLDAPEFYRAGMSGLEDNWMRDNSFGYQLRFF
jgi:uncharacterized protein (DUF4213/DUF364 family)